VVSNGKAAAAQELRADYAQICGTTGPATRRMPSAETPKA